QLIECDWLCGLKHGDARNSQCEIDVLAVSDFDRDDADHLSAHVQERTTAVTVRDRSSDLNDATDSRHFAHGGNDAIADRALESQRIPDQEDLLAFVRQSSRQRKRTCTFSRYIYTEQRKIGFFIYGQSDLDRIVPAFAFERMNLDSTRAPNDVHVSDDLSGADKESAAADQRLSLRVISQHGNHRRLNAPHEIGKRFMCLSGKLQFVDFRGIGIRILCPNGLNTRN